MSEKYKDYLRIFPGIFLVLILVIIVFANGITTTYTIKSQAAKYLDQASDRAAEELEKTFHRQEESMLTMAHMTAHIMDFERIDTAKLVHLTEKSSFDGIEYIHPSGGCYGMNETGWDVSEKDYFKDGVLQNVGYAYDDAPERGESGCIVFYAPIVSDNGDFYGILVGYFLEETIKNMLDVSFWGHSTKQYLCNADGTIIASNDQVEQNTVITDLYRNSGSMSSAECEQLAEQLKTGSGNFEYKRSGRVELGSIGNISDEKFLLIETFPPEVLSELTAPATRKMHIVAAAVIVSLSVYGFLMFVLNRKMKKHLEDENDKVNLLLKGAEDHANHDPLTGLLNRRGMMETLDRRELQNHSRAVLVMDIDKFKEINDNYGHQTGDQMLKKAASLMRSVFRSEDILVRMGGDEFLVVLPEFRADQAEIIKKKIYELNEKFQHPTDGLPVASFSVGAAFSRQGEKDELLIRADKALYKMKEQGRCGCCIYEEVFG